MTVSSTQSNLPDYGQMVKFLFQPFLTVADELRVDCEYTIDRHRVWIRVAVATIDQGSAFGRGGRNIQAIRTVLQAAATAVGQSVHLDVYGSSSSTRQESTDRSTSGEGASANRSARTMPNRRPPNSGERRSGDSSAPPTPRPRRSGDR